MTPAAKWEPRLMTLCDGSLALSDSPEWRQETFARELLAGPPGRTAAIFAELDPEVAAALRETMAKLEAGARA